jgi:hypothetical protein
MELYPTAPYAYEAWCLVKPQGKHYIFTFPTYCNESLTDCWVDGPGSDPDRDIESIFLHHAQYCSGDAFLWRGCYLVAFSTDLEADTPGRVGINSRLYEVLLNTVFSDMEQP